MSETWQVPKAEPMTWTAELVESRAAPVRGGLLLEVTLRSAMARAWNPAAPGRSIQGPGVVQYRLDSRDRWSVQLHTIGQCLGTVRPRNEDILCPVTDLPAGFTRCPEHHAPGCSGLPR